MADINLTNSVVWYGDEFIPFENASISIASASVLYGLSVYTVFAVNKTEKGLAAFRLLEHFNRLLDSAQIMGLDTFQPEWDFDRFKETVQKLLLQNKIDDDVLVRATVYVVDNMPGTRSRGLTTKLGLFISPALPLLPLSGARLKTSVWKRVPDYAIPARAKVNGAYVNSVLAKQEALDNGYDDCIFLDNLGHVCELSTANVFIVKDNTLITPSATNDILEGITRKTIVEYAKLLRIPVQHRTVDLTELYIADEVIACGTTAYIAPVVEVDARIIGSGEPGAITQKLAKLHTETLHGQSPDFKSHLTVL